MTHLNLKYNPVASSSEYYKQIKDMVPNIEELDDEPVSDNFFERKIQQEVKQLVTKDFLELKMSQTFMSFGISKEFLQILNTEQI